MATMGSFDGWLQEDVEVAPEPECVLQALLEAGASERLVNLPWVANNLRWVMWKLVSLACSCQNQQKQQLSWAVLVDEMMRRSATCIYNRPFVPLS